MNLLHYAREPFRLDRTMEYEQQEPRTFGKPVGLWVSVQGEDDWKSWCEDESFDLDRLKFANRIELAVSARILYISTPEGINTLCGTYAIQNHDNPMFWAIDWQHVASQYDGIIIAPYQWSCRYSHDWYYGWDCASGCIWNLSAIESVQEQVNYDGM